MGRARKKTVLTIAPDQLPNPWLADSEFLLNELARIRELVLKIPHHNNTNLPANTVIDSLWRLEQQLRYLLHLHREGQRSFAQKTTAVPAERSHETAVKEPQQLRIKA